MHFGPGLFPSPGIQLGARVGPSGLFWSIVYGAIIGLAGLVGDLCESLVKRDLGKKDAASLLPGFGGLLDLLDSILYAGPVAYVPWKVLPIDPWP